jgi:hypothetical protein
LKRLEIFNAKGKLGSDLPLAIAFTACLETETDTDKSACVQTLCTPITFIGF